MKAKKEALDVLHFAREAGAANEVGSEAGAIDGHLAREGEGRRDQEDEKRAHYVRACRG